MKEESYHSTYVKLCVYVIWFSQQSYETDNLIPILQMKKWRLHHLAVCLWSACS